MQLTLEQQAVLADTSASLLVCGGPGSGKTTVGLLRAKGCVAAGLADNQSVLFLSFSNSAVTQIQRAARIKLLPAERRAINIQTFHSFCWDILRCYGNIVGLHLPLSTVPPEEEAVLSAGLADAEWASRRLLLAKTEGRVVFDLFAQLTADIFDRCEQVRSTFASCHPLVLVDEFQDTDDEQWRVVDTLTRQTNLIALADPYQRIYDFRPGVRPDRLERFAESRSAHVIELGEANHRSPDHDILRFADHVLHPARGPITSSSVSVQTYEFYGQCGVQLKWAVMNSIKAVQRLRGDGPVTVLVLGAANKSVQQLSNWLVKQTPKAKFSIKHDLWVDSDEITCAWYVLLSILEAGCQRHDEGIASILARLSDLRRCEGTKTSIEDSEKLLAWRTEVLAGRRPLRAPLIAQLADIVERCSADIWSGDVIADCDRTIVMLSEASDKRLATAVDLCALRRPFRPGEATCTVVEKLFRDQGHYCGAIRHFQRAAQHDRMADRFVSFLGCNVMTLHKCKGKEFDAVVIVDGLKEPHRLVCRGDQAPFDRSRRLLRVGITRARYTATILTPKADSCPLLPQRSSSVSLVSPGKRTPRN